MTYKNMKTEINDEQPLGDVVKELERLGYQLNFRSESTHRVIYAFDAGYFGIYSNTNKTCTNNSPLTTLQQLREMK